MRFEIDVNVHFQDQEAVRLLHLVLAKLDSLSIKGDSIMATLDQILADVTDQSTKLDSIAALIAGLKQQIADALAGVTLPPAVQAKVDAIFTAAEGNSAKIQTALDANVTPTP